VIVLSDHLWRTQFGADRGVIGKPLVLDDQHVTIIGVGPRDFTGDDLHPSDAWMPVASTPQPPFMHEPLLSSNGMYVFQAIGRVGPDDDLRAFSVRATQQLRAFIRSTQDTRDTMMAVTTGSINVARGPGDQRQSNLISTRLSAVALIVLIIAAANVVNLLLSRATHRRRELAVRLALGISRGRLVRMLTAETLLLALVAAVVSLAVAWWGGSALRTLVLSDVHFVDAPVDGRIVVFTIGIAVLAGLAAGIVPAIQASNPELTRALKDGARDGTSRRSRLRSALLVTQTALSVALLAGAALFVESLRNVQGLNIGYDARNTVVASIDFDAGRAPQPAVENAQMADVEREVAKLPGVEAAARTLQVPLMGVQYAPLFVGSDTANPSPGNYPVLNMVTQNFFAASGLRLLRGHAFVDRPGAAPEVVINEAMARRLFPRADALKGCLRFQPATGECWPISGIVANAPTMDITDPALQYYLPISNPPKALEAQAVGTALVARVAPDAALRVEAGVRQALLREFPNSYPNVRLLSDVIAPQYQPWRVGASLFSGMSILAVLVAIVGIYSTVSYSVGQRTHEFGVRIALGAQLRDVLRLVLGEGMRTLVIGVVIGIVLAVLGGRLIASLLFGVSPSNPFVMAMVSVLLLLVAAVATLIPAVRAGRVDPMIALRAE
jgi:predicted permease